MQTNGDDSLAADVAELADLLAELEELAAQRGDPGLVDRVLGWLLGE